MSSRVQVRASKTPRSPVVSLLVLGLISFLALPGGLTLRAAESATSNQCVACHTDAAKLKALTPSDPPVAETGEG